MTDRRNFIKQTGSIIMGVGGATFAGGLSAELIRINSKRVFVARFAHETNTFHPVSTSSWRFQEAGKPKLKVWENADFEIVPGVSATPEGGGLLLEKPCREAMNRILDSLRKVMPVDATFLNLHGAMYAEGVGHAETVFVGEVREIVGAKVPVACTFDLHGNIPSCMGRYGNIMAGLKTAPHTDSAETAELAGKILLDTLEGRVNPVSFILPVPIIVQGEKAMTSSEPFGSLVEEARRIERQGIPGFRERILAVTLFVGCAWTDAPATGMSVMVTADRSVKAAQAAAVYLAGRIWDARSQFEYGCETAELDEGISRALDLDDPTVFLTDSGDNVTASTPGDLPGVLRRLVERKVRSAVVACINDASATQRCFEAGNGARVRLSIGAKIEKRYGPPFETEAEIKKLIQQPKMAVIKIEDVEAILTDGPATFTNLSQFELCSINPRERKIIAVKMGYLYPGLIAIAPRYIMLLTPGAGDMRIEKLTYNRIRRPIFPLDPDTKFEPSEVKS